jgi:hypothetical protein
MNMANGVRYRNFFRRFIDAVVAIGNLLIFLAHIFGPIAIIFGLRIEVMTGKSYPHSKEMIFVALIGVALLLLFLFSQYKSFMASGKWRWVLIFCLAALMLVGLSDAVLGHMEYGLAYIVVRGYVSSAIFCAWMAFNFYYWFYLRSNATKTGTPTI